MTKTTPLDGFNSPLLRRCGTAYGRTIYRLESPLVYRCGLTASGGIRVRVPRGFETDFASIPRLLRRIFPPDGQWGLAAVLHDFLYSRPGVRRFLADALFRDAMAQLKVPLWRRVPLYYAVRIFGGLFRVPRAEP